VTDSGEELSGGSDTEPEETIATPAAPRANDPLAALPRLASPVYRPPNLWLRAFLAAAILAAAVVVVIVLLLR
jgi:hypothetical protein